MAAALAAPQAVYRCESTQCSFVCSAVTDLLRHFRVVNHPNFSCNCCFNSCCAGPFFTVSALKSHIYRNHYERPELVNEGSSDDYVFNLPIEPSTEYARDPELQADIHRLTGLDLDEQKKSSALFLLKLKEVLQTYFSIHNMCI